MSVGVAVDGARFTVGGSHKCNRMLKCIIMAGYELDDLDLLSCRGTEFRLVLEYIHPSIRYVLGVLSPGVKQPEHEANHSPLSSIKIKDV
jgi:hypothetical protein